MTAPLFWLSASYLRLTDWNWWEHPQGPDRITFSIDFGGLFRIGAEIKPDDKRSLGFYCNGSRVTLGDRPIDWKLAGQTQPDWLLVDIFYSGIQDLLTTPDIEADLRNCYAERRLPTDDIHVVPPSWGGQAIWIPISDIKLYGVGMERGVVYGHIALDRFISIRDLYFFQPSVHHGRIPRLDEIYSPQLRTFLMEALSKQRMLDDLRDGDTELNDYRGVIAGRLPDTLIPIHLGHMPPVLTTA